MSARDLAPSDDGGDAQERATEAPRRAEKPAPWEGGKCRVPMWCMGVPDGYCDKPANGPQLPRLVLDYLCWRDPPYCFGPCCPAHGGPRDGEPILFQDGLTPEGRPMWCAVMPAFINLQESPAGFDGNPLVAMKALEVALADLAALGGDQQ